MAESGLRYPPDAQTGDPDQGTLAEFELGYDRGGFATGSRCAFILLPTIPTL